MSTRNLSIGLDLFPSFYYRRLDTHRLPLIVQIAAQGAEVRQCAALTLREAQTKAAELLARPRARLTLPTEPERSQ